ncbi:acyltransferase [Cellulomonas humilata]|uniref:Acyltransferase n=1 Tax=Cellulomonas humilata TaxID=144055 RepID=A0A7Y5ZZF9_9CELL|nr:acyltransferase [Cellulomonas humilata]
MTELGTKASAPGRLHALDYMRLAAALSVLAFHYFFNGILNGKIASLQEPTRFADVAKYGHLGVNWFFLISGFIIFQSAHGKSAREFAVGRAVRLYPAFWAAVALTTVVTIFWGARSHLTVSPVQVLANLTMVPRVFGAAPVDGVYWTLQLEIFFYLVVFSFLLARRLDLFARLLPLWALANAAGVLVLHVPDSTPLLGGYFALFAAGAIIAEVQRDGWTAWRTVGLVAAYVASAVTATRHIQDLARELETSFNQAFVAASMLLIFGSLLLLAIPAVRDVRLPAAVALGALTYPLYLIHAHIGYIALTHFARPASRAAAYIGIIAAVVAVAWVIHRVVERRPRSAWYLGFDWVYSAFASIGSRLTSRSRSGPPVQEDAPPERSLGDAGSPRANSPRTN